MTDRSTMIRRTSWKQVAWGLALAAPSILPAGRATAQGLGQGAPLGPPRGAEEIASIGQPSITGRLNANSLAIVADPKAVARVEGIPSPGLRLTLDGKASSGGKLWYRWIQTQGSKVAIDDPTQPEAHLIVPADASTLGFVLVVGNGTSVDAKGVMVDVDDSDPFGDKGVLKADAGDDKSSRVGRRVVLNGARSAPKGRLQFRWVQTGGPKVVMAEADQAMTSFVPEAPGLYQFTLFVATPAGALSNPSTVSISVSRINAASAIEEKRDLMAIDELARTSLASIQGGQKFAQPLSEAFDAVANRIDSYRSYAEASNEMGRQLDGIVPRDKEHRAIWLDRFFKPLLDKLVDGMKGEGIDLTRTDGQTRPLTPEQRKTLADQFRMTAAGLRSGIARR